MHKKKHDKTQPLLAEIQRITLFTSIFLIFFLQFISLIVTSYLIINDLNHKAVDIADELYTVFQDPLYNVDDSQTIRIAEALLSSGRISGLTIDSSASGKVFDRALEKGSSWIKSQSREVFYDSHYLGRITLQFSDKQFSETVMQFFILIISVIVAFLLIYFILTRVLVQKRITSTFAILSDGINEIAEGNYKNIIPLTHYSDIDEIINLINDMSSKIDNKNKQLLDINNQLENRVQERTSELRQSLSELKQMQQRLIESGKLSALGQLVAGIAHELNTPLGAIKSSIFTSIDYQNTVLKKCSTIFSSFSNNEMTLFKKIIEIGNEKNQTINMQFLGRKELRAAIKILDQNGVTDSSDIANVLADTNLLEDLQELLPIIKAANSERLGDVVQFAGEMILIRRMSEIIEVSVMKSETVMNALRTYLNPSEKGSGQILNLGDNIRQVLTLMHNMLKHGIDIKIQLKDVFIEASSDELSQIWMNLIRNAVQAMDFRGEMKINMVVNQKQVNVHVIDHGAGIPAEIKSRIFDPFFTTKKNGEGMGLGLDITKRLVKSWNGSISIESYPGYTEVIVSFPLAKFAK